MSYGMAWALQEALYQRLSTATATAALLGGRIYDAAPQDESALPRDAVYATLGDEDVDDWSTATDAGAEHLVTITVHAPQPGFAAAKRAAAAISDTLLAGSLSPARGRVISVNFVDARTKRTEGHRLRQIRMRFRVVLEDTA